MNIDPVAAAIRQAEHTEAETRYRLQLAREMYQAGQRAGFESGYRQADADEAAALGQGRPAGRARDKQRRARGTAVGTWRPDPFR